VFAVTALGTGLVNLALSIPPLLLLMLATGCPVRPAMLFLPVAVLLLSMFTMGVGLILSTLVIYFADVYEMFQILLMSWFYLQPTMYPLEIIPESSRWLFKLNPLYYYLELFRSPIHQGVLAPWPFLVIGSLIAVVTLGFGWWLFTKHADQLAYRV
jgi:ABC-type polysaccharide/polyol phosphate export permease